MAIQTLEPGTSSGRILGRGLGAGIEALAEYKVNQLIQRQNEKRTQDDLVAAGYSESEAKVLAGLPPRERELMLRNTRPIEEQTRQDMGQSPEGGMQNLQQFAPQQPLNANQNLQQTMQALGIPFNQRSLGQTLGIPQAQERMAQFNQQRQMTPQQVPQAPIQQQQAAAAQPQQVAPQQEQAAPIKPEIKKPRLTALGKLAAGQTGNLRQQEAAQKRIDKANAPFVDAIKKNVPVAKEQVEMAQELIDLINTGKVAEGWAGWAQSKAPLSFMNDETQRAYTLMNRLANLEARGMGQITNAKLRLAQDVKPNLQKSRAVQLKETEEILNRAQRFLNTNDLIDQYSEGGQPENLEKLVNSQLESSREESNIKLSRESIAEKPAASSAPGKIIKNEETGEFEQSIDGKWVPVKKVSGKWIRA